MLMNKGKNMAKIVTKSPHIIPEIINYVQSGEIVILHTDVVYIFIANALIPQCVNKIHELKKWQPRLPLALLTNSHKAGEYLIMNEDIEKLIALYPYPISLIVPHKNNLPDELTVGHKTVFVSCPDDYIYSLIEQSPVPLVCGTASLGVDYKAKRADVAENLFGDNVALIVDGDKSKHDGLRTTLIDCSLPLPTIMNYGIISYDDLRPILPHIELPSHLRK